MKILLRDLQTFSNGKSVLIKCIDGKSFKPNDAQMYESNRWIVNFMTLSVYVLAFKSFEQDREEFEPTTSQLLYQLIVVK